MSKIHRGGRSAEGEPLSAGRVEYLEAARARARAKHIRRTVIIVAALTIVILFATGVVGSSIARAKDLVDSVHIALTPASGWPQQPSEALHHDLWSSRHEHARHPAALILPSRRHDCTGRHAQSGLRSSPVA